MRVTGVDGCRDGWAAVDLADGRLAGVRISPSLESVLAPCPAGQVVAIDMPLGLLPGGWRLADQEARRLLGPRRNSVFMIPPGPVWQEPDYRAASDRCRALTGNRLSAQAWGLRDKLLEANGYRLRGRHRLYEVHPELSFQAMTGRPLRYAKRIPAGHAERRAALANAGIEMPPPLARHAALADTGIDVPAEPAWRRAAIDVLDAAAAAWSAQRIAAGRARVLPDPPETDAHGLEIAVRY